MSIFNDPVLNRQWDRAMDHLSTDIKHHEDNQDRLQKEFEAAYPDNLAEIINIAKELLTTTGALVKSGHIESMEPDVVMFICIMFRGEKASLNALPDSFRNELFEGVCRKLDYDCDDYIDGLMVAT